MFVAPFNGLGIRLVGTDGWSWLRRSRSRVVGAGDWRRQSELRRPSRQGRDWLLALGKTGAVLGRLEADRARRRVRVPGVARRRRRGLPRIGQCQAWHRFHLISLTLAAWTHLAS